MLRSVEAQDEGFKPLSVYIFVPTPAEPLGRPAPEVCVRPGSSGMWYCTVLSDVLDIRGLKTVTIRGQEFF